MEAHELGPGGRHTAHPEPDPAAPSLWAVARPGGACRASIYVGMAAPPPALFRIRVGSRALLRRAQPLLRLYVLQRALTGPPLCPMCALSATHMSHININ